MTTNMAKTRQSSVNVTRMFGGNADTRLALRHATCSFGRIRLISHGLSANGQYFSLTPNQPIVLLAMTYKPNKSK